jgi:hypothetical protein
MKSLVACALVLPLLIQSASAAEPTDAQKAEWLALQRAAIADPDDPAKLKAFLDLLGRFGDEYVVEGDILMSEEEVQLYLEKKRQAPTLADTAGELIVEKDEQGNRIFWKRPEDRILTYAIRRDGFPNGLHEKVAALMEQATTAWEEACPTCGIDFQYQAAEDVNPSLERVKFIVEYREPGPGDSPNVLAFAFFPNDPPSEFHVVVLPAFFTSVEDQTAVLIHELGHVLGYRHEHILSPDAGCAAYKAGELAIDSTFEPLGGYDVKSIMHYPCGGKAAFLPALSDGDEQQHSQLYGSGK